MDKKDLDQEYDPNFRVCSLSGNTDQKDVEQLERLSKDSQYYCLTCKRSSNDAARLCSPAFL